MWPCPNPHHAQTGRTPPVSIFASHRGEQRWRCHGCGDGGSAIDLVIACHGGTTRDAMTFLADRTGHREQSDVWHSARRAERPRSLPPARCRDPEGLDRYVDECAERLWKPEGHAMRRWLTETRKIPRGVLLDNRVGADLGPRVQTRPDGMPRAGGVVLPVLRDGHAVYAQLRVLQPRPDRPRYLNPTADLATNPRLARIRPIDVRHREVIVTEGAMDGLSAAAAGYRAVAVLSATYGDEAVAVALAKLPHPLVIAFDADDAGRTGAHKLASLLASRQRPAVVLDLGSGDLNDVMRRSANWPADLGETIEGTSRNAGKAISLGR